MKKLKTRNEWKASNVQLNLDPHNESAYSYDWWQFFTKSETTGTYFFNGYSYSPSTGAHQRKVLDVLVDVLSSDVYDSIQFIESHGGLQHGPVACMKENVETLQIEIKELNEAIAKPRTHKAKNEKRKQSIASKKAQIHRLELLIRKEQDAVSCGMEVFERMNEGMKEYKAFNDSTIVSIMADVAEENELKSKIIHVNFGR